MNNKRYDFIKENFEQFLQSQFNEIEGSLVACECLTSHEVYNEKLKLLNAFDEYLGFLYHSSRKQV